MRNLLIKLPQDQRTMRFDWWYFTRELLGGCRRLINWLRSMWELVFFIPENNVCQNLGDDNFLSSDGINPSCTQCSSLYYLNGDSHCDLIANQKTCQSSNGKNNACDVCINGYWTNNGVCTQIPSCLNSDGLANACISANQNTSSTIINYVNPL